MFTLSFTRHFPARINYSPEYSMPSSPDMPHTFPLLCLPWMVLLSLLCFPRSSPSSSCHLRFSNPEEKPNDSGLNQDTFGFPAQIQKCTFQGWFSCARIHWRPRTIPPPIPSCFTYSFCPVGCRMANPTYEHHMSIRWRKLAKASLWGDLSLRETCLVHPIGQEYAILVPRLQED